jgi:hypothetical protein
MIRNLQNREKIAFLQVDREDQGYFFVIAGIKVADCNTREIAKEAKIERVQKV